MILLSLLFFLPSASAQGQNPNQKNEAQKEVEAKDKGSQTAQDLGIVKITENGNIWQISRILTPPPGYRFGAGSSETNNPELTSVTTTDGTHITWTVTLPAKCWNRQFEASLRGPLIPIGGGGGKPPPEKEFFVKQAFASAPESSLSLTKLYPAVAGNVTPEPHWETWEVSVKPSSSVRTVKLNLIPGATKFSVLNPLTEKSDLAQQDSARLNMPATLILPAGQESITFRLLSSHLSGTEFYKIEATRTLGAEILKAEAPSNSTLQAAPSVYACRG